MSNVLKENYKKLVDALAPYFGGASDFDNLTNRPQESDTIDISDLNLPMPAKPTEYPILFDETSTEYQVGWYKRASDGKVKPVYRKDYINSTTITFGANSWTTLISDNLLNDIDFVRDISIKRYGTEITKPQESEIYNGNIRIYSLMADNFPANGIISVEYTLSTDEWKEV